MACIPMEYYPIIASSHLSPLPLSFLQVVEIGYIYMWRSRIMRTGAIIGLNSRFLQVQMIQVHWLYSDTPVVSWETRSSLINYLQVEYCEYCALALTCRAVHWHTSMKKYLWLLFVVVPLRQYSEEAHGLIHCIVKKPLCLSISYRYTAWLMIAYDLQPLGQFKIDLIYPLILGS